MHFFLVRLMNHFCSISPLCGKYIVFWCISFLCDWCIVFASISPLCDKCIVFWWILSCAIDTSLCCISPCAVNTLCFDAFHPRGINASFLNDITFVREIHCVLMLFFLMRLMHRFAVFHSCAVLDCVYTIFFLLRLMHRFLLYFTLVW